MHLVVPKYLVSNIFERCFWPHLGLKYPSLTKFIQNIDPNSRMPGIFMDLVDKSAFYIIFSRNILTLLDAVYSTRIRSSYHGQQLYEKYGLNDIIIGSVHL